MDEVEIVVCMTAPASATHWRVTSTRETTSTSLLLHCMHAWRQVMNC